MQIIEGQIGMGIDCCKESCADGKSDKTGESDYQQTGCCDQGVGTGEQDEGGSIGLHQVEIVTIITLD